MDLHLQIEIKTTKGINTASILVRCLPLLSVLYFILVRLWNKHFCWCKSHWNSFL